MTPENNPFGVDGLTSTQIERLLQAANMIADGDAEMYERILDGTSSNLETLMQNCDGSDEAMATVVDQAETQMPDLAFGDDDAVFDQLATEPANDLASLLEDDGTDDEFMGGGNFTSLSELEAEELGDGDVSYEEFQDEWN